MAAFPTVAPPTLGTLAGVIKANHAQPLGPDAPIPTATLLTQDISPQPSQLATGFTGHVSGNQGSQVSQRLPQPVGPVLPLVDPRLEGQAHLRADYWPQGAPAVEDDQSVECKSKSNRRRQKQRERRRIGLMDQKAAAEAQTDAQSIQGRGFAEESHTSQSPPTPAYVQAVEDGKLSLQHIGQDFAYAAPAQTVPQYSWIASASSAPPPPSGPIPNSSQSASNVPRAIAESLLSVEDPPYVIGPTFAVASAAASSSKASGITAPAWPSQAASSSTALLAERPLSSAKASALNQLKSGIRKITKDHGISCAQAKASVQQNELQPLSPVVAKRATQAAEAAIVVQTAINETRLRTWQSLVQEFEVQQLVWTDTLFMNSEGTWSLPIQFSTAPYATVQAKIQNILQLAVTDPLAAAELLHEVVHRDSLAERFLNNAMQAAAANIATGLQLASLRRQLEHILTSIASMPLMAPLDAFGGFLSMEQLEALLQTCKLGKKEEALVRQVIGLEKQEEPPQPKVDEKVKKNRSGRALSANHIPVKRPSSCSSSSSDRHLKRGNRHYHSSSSLTNSSSWSTSTLSSKASGARAFSRNRSRPMLSKNGSLRLKL